jgi:hypothetical protein
MRDNIEITFKTRVMYITMDRTRRKPIALLRALPNGYWCFFGEMASHGPAGDISLQWRLYGLTEVSCLPASRSESAARWWVNR